VTRRFRGATYEIEVQNPDGLQRGVSTLLVNGQPQEGNLLTPAPAGSTVKVVARLGA
jgi:cellobiose phosphorylase